MKKDNLNNAIQRTPEVKVTSGCGSMKTRTIIERVCVRSSENSERLLCDSLGFQRDFLFRFRYK